MARTRQSHIPGGAFDRIQRALSAFTFNSAGLAIKQASSALAKAGTAFHSIIDGTTVTKAANTDMAALTGDAVPTTQKNVYVFTVNASGTLATRAGKAATTLAGIVFPEIPDGEAIIGFILVENATGSDFTPGTTALDTASLTVTYVNTPYPWLPNLHNLV